MSFAMTDRLQLGDILIVNRGLYKHYGIYAGDNTVIHYAALTGDWGKNVCIHEAPLERFSKGDKILVAELNRHSGCTVYSPEETVARARSRLGEHQYNLITNNCEHFALWCKTGDSQSWQVTTVVNALAVTGYVVLSTAAHSAAKVHRLHPSENDTVSALNIIPTERVSILTAEALIGFFKNDETLAQLRNNPQLKAVAIKQDGNIILCLYNSKTQTTEGNAVMYRTQHLDEALITLFGDKEMLILQ